MSSLAGLMVTEDEKKPSLFARRYKPYAKCAKSEYLNRMLLIYHIHNKVLRIKVKEVKEKELSRLRFKCQHLKD